MLSLLSATMLVAARLASAQPAPAQTEAPANRQQQVEQLQRQHDEREARRSEPDVRLQPFIELPAGDVLPAESPCFTARELVLVVPPQLPTAQQRLGASALGNDPFHFLVEALLPYRGRCIGVQGINLILQRLGGLILARGYSTTRLGVGEQDLASGILELVLVPGVISSISVSAPHDGASWKSAFPSRPGDLLNLRDLEQALEQWRHVASQDAEMRLLPGAHPGQTDIVIDLQRRRPWRVAWSLDDSGSKGTGKWQSSLSLMADNLFNLNEQFSVMTARNLDQPASQGGSGAWHMAYSMPWGDWTFGASAGNHRYHQTIAGRHQRHRSHGMSQHLTLRATRLVQRDARQKNSLQLKLGKRRSRAFMAGRELGNQHRNTSHLELAWLHRHHLGSAQLDLALANRWGVAWFGGEGNLAWRRPGQPSLRYSLQTLDVTLAVPLAPSLSYLGTWRGQWTRTPLFAVDKMAIGHRYSVRGFDGEACLSGDRGWFLRNEVVWQPQRSGQSLYGGVDGGTVHAMTDDCRGGSLAGAVLGARGAFGRWQYDTFIGWPLHKPQQWRTATRTIGMRLGWLY